MISRVLTEDQITKIHETSLAILEKVGVVVPHNEMLSRFADAGARVEYESQRVCVPPDLVVGLLDKAGKSYTLYGRDTSRVAHFGQGKRNYNSTSGQASWLGSPGGERRYAILDDVVTASRSGDYLDGLTIVGAMADPCDIPVEYRCVEVMAVMIKNTLKPITFWFHNRASAKYIVDMIITLRGSLEEAAGYPICCPFLEPISPLRFPFDGIDLLFETARINAPVPVGPMAQTGLSAPGTLSGTMALENAEVLAGICITQLIRPGMPVCYGGICHAFDMRTTQTIFGGPEQAIFGVAMTQMGKQYGLPVYINSGLTDSKRPDAQAGMEIAVTLAMGASAGADVFGHMGICGVDQAASLQMLVLQNEVISYVESMMRDIDFSEDALGLDEIIALGSGGSFISSHHTARHFRQELWFPRLHDREYYQAWIESGAKSMEDRCCEHIDEAIASYTPQPIDCELASALDEVVAEARSELGKRAG